MTLGPNALATLRSVDWLWPAYMRRGYVMDLVARLDAQPAGPLRDRVFEDALPRMYSPQHLAGMVLDRYPHVPYVRLFEQHIAEAVETAHLGLYRAAVTLLIPTIEGIVRAHAAAEARDLRNAGQANLTAEITAMVGHERTRYPQGENASDERVAMIDAFSQFLLSSLYRHTTQFAGTRELNRHGAVHGIYRDYGVATNFYVLMSIVDLLTFILTFRTSGVSMLAPDVTAQTTRLALYYRGSRELIGGAARLARARR